MDKVNKAFDFWISQFPESVHPLDKERYFKFIDEVAATDESIDNEWFEEKLAQSKHRMSEDQVLSLTQSFNLLVSYAKYKQGR